MKRLNKRTACLLILLLTYCLPGCKSLISGKLIMVSYDKENELKRKWEEYTVYYTESALLYKIKDDRQIELDNSWVEITTEDMMARSVVFDFVQVAKVLGRGEEPYGYLIHRDLDVVYLEVINSKTIKLHYTYVTPSGGP